MKIINNQLYKYPILTKNFKGKYPFRLGTTSFIYPDDYTPNVKLLGPFVDEVELLLFESQPAGSLPAGSVVEELVRLSQDLNLTYNVHLPTDIVLGRGTAADQQRAVDTLVRISELTAPLCPTSYALHLPFDGNLRDRNAVSRWRDTVWGNLEKLLSDGIAPDLMAIETLDYPIEILENMIFDLNLAVCLDIGHLIVYDHDLQSVFNRYGHRLAMIHLHGVDGGRDHLPLNRLPRRWIEPVFRILNQYTGSVSLEVFAFESLESSLNFLESSMEVND